MSDQKEFPANWLLPDYDPNQHMMSLKGRDYLNVQNRLLWFIRDQRELIVRGLATCSYIIRTELVEVDRAQGFAHFSCYVRDVLGNETTSYGSETAKDFGDYIEKAATKAEGRALLNLGYGTAMAPEMDEGERVVDSPVARREPHLSESREKTSPTSSAAPASSQHAVANGTATATAEQRERMRKYRDALEIVDRSIAQTDDHLSVAEAEARISAYIEHWKKRQMRQTAGTGTGTGTGVAS